MSSTELVLSPSPRSEIFQPWTRNRKIKRIHSATIFKNWGVASIFETFDVVQAKIIRSFRSFTHQLFSTIPTEFYPLKLAIHSLYYRYEKRMMSNTFFPRWNHPEQFFVSILLPDNKKKLQKNVVKGINSSQVKVNFDDPKWRTKLIAIIAHDWNQKENINKH